MSWLVTVPSWWQNIWANLLTGIGFSLQLCRPSVAIDLCWRRPAWYGICGRGSFFLNPRDAEAGWMRGAARCPLSCPQAHSRWLNFLLPGSTLQPLLPFPKSTIGQWPTFEPVNLWEMFKGQTVKCSFEQTRMYFKADKRTMAYDAEWPWWGHTLTGRLPVLRFKALPSE